MITTGACTSTIAAWRSVRRAPSRGVAARLYAGDSAAELVSPAGRRAPPLPPPPAPAKARRRSPELRPSTSLGRLMERGPAGRVKSSGVSLQEVKPGETGQNMWQRRQRELSFNSRWLCAKDASIGIPVRISCSLWEMTVHPHCWRGHCWRTCCPGCVWGEWCAAERPPAPRRRRRPASPARWRTGRRPTGPQ